MLKTAPEATIYKNPFREIAVDEEKKRTDELEEAGKSKKDLTTSEINTAEASSSAPEPDSSEAGPIFAWEELKNDSAEGALSQAAQDLADYSKLKEDVNEASAFQNEPSPPKQEQEPRAGLGNRMVWTVAGGFILAGFLAWTISSFTLKMPYRIEALIVLLSGVGWLGLGLKKLKLPTVVGGLAFIWTLGLLLGALYGPPALAGPGERAAWERTLLFLAPVGLFTFTTLAALWGLFLVLKNRIPRFVGLAFIVWGAIPLAAAYYSVRAGHREASFTAWLSNPVEFLSPLPWFVSPAFFTLLIIPFIGFLLWLARQAILFKLTKINRHFGPLWLAMSFLISLLLGGVYLENVFHKNLGFEKTVLKATPWVKRTVPEIAAEAAAPGEAEIRLPSEPPSSSEEEIVSANGRPAPPESAESGAAVISPAPGESDPARPEAGPDEVGRRLEDFKREFWSSQEEGRYKLQLLQDRLDRLEAQNKILREELNLLKNRLEIQETEPSDAFEVDSTADGPEAGPGHEPQSPGQAAAEDNPNSSGPAWPEVPFSEEPAAPGPPQALEPGKSDDAWREPPSPAVRLRGNFYVDENRGPDRRPADGSARRPGGRFWRV